MRVAESNEAPKTSGPPPGSQSVVVAFRILLLIFAAAAVAGAVVVAVDRPRKDDSDARYVCPMHPEVTAVEQGQCPICRMALEPAVGRAPTGSKPTRGGMAGMADMTAVENVRKHRIVDFARKHSLLFDTRELRGPAWVEDDHVIAAVFYNDQIDALVADEPGSFSPTEAPRTTFAVRRTADPVVAWDRSTSRIRFQLDTGHTSKAAGPLPGAIGWLELARRSREVLTVPASSVLQGPEGPYVLVPGGDGRVDKRPIEIGETFLKQGLAVVLSGLRVHDRVISRATFFLDADRRLGSRAGEDGWTAP